MPIKEQVHDKFKVFVGKSIDKVAAEVASFTANGQVAAKSIGIQYLEPDDEVLVSLGYASGKAGYPVSLKAVPLGKLDTHAKNFAGLEAALEKAAVGSNVVCHELYADAQDNLTLVLMIHG